LVYEPRKVSSIQSAAITCPAIAVNKAAAAQADSIRRRARAAWRKPPPATALT
jgi:hypothetical protein